MNLTEVKEKSALSGKKWDKFIKNLICSKSREGGIKNENTLTNNK